MSAAIVVSNAPPAGREEQSVCACACACTRARVCMHGGGSSDMRARARVRVCMRVCLRGSRHEHDRTSALSFTKHRNSIAVEIWVQRRSTSSNLKSAGAATAWPASPTGAAVASPAACGGCGETAAGPVRRKKVRSRSSGRYRWGCSPVGGGGGGGRLLFLRG